MLVGYMRVSTDSDRQVLDLQRDALLSAGVDERHLFEDRVSGSQGDRAGLVKALAFLRPGDCLVVWKLERLGRSLPHLLTTVTDLKTRGIAFRSPRRRPGTPWLKTLLVQAAWCGVRTKGSYFRALFLRLKARRGPKKAIVAGARATLTAVYGMLRAGVDYHDRGPDDFQRAERTRLANRRAQRLDELGFD